MEGITPADAIHAKNVWKGLEIKNFDVFEKICNLCCKVYKLDRSHFISISGLAWQAA